MVSVSRQFTSRTIGLILGLSMALTASWWWVAGHRPPSATIVASPQNGFVDAAVCANCHPAIAKTYKLTGMGRSFYKPRPGRMDEFRKPSTLYHRASERYYAMSERDGRYFVRRHQKGFDGSETNV